MAVDYDKKRTTATAAVEEDRTEELTDLETTYGKQNADGSYTSGLIGATDKAYQNQINATKEWQKEAEDLQNKQYDFAVQKIEQQKEQTNKDYIKEQSGAYVDWQKQSNKYGAEAEQKATQGLTNTGYSESSQVSMYNTYQNRVATAREAFERAMLNYSNQMHEAWLQNSVALAEIAKESLQKQLELAVSQVTARASLVSDMVSQKNAINTRYDNKYTDVLNQINHEESFAEEVRQYNEKMAEEKRQYNASLALQQAQLAEEKRQFDILHPQKSADISPSKSTGSNKSSNSSKKSSSVSNTKKRTVSPSSKATNNNGTYRKAAAELQKAKATTGDGGLMTKNEWTRRKNSGSKRAYAKYDTYEDYVNSFVTWRKANPEK